ncbi:hypothetical protein DPMN_171752, partial [Dreissena polymorpha]
MEYLASMFTEKEKWNWLKAWLALDIARSGLEQFVEREAKIVHADIYQAAKSNTIKDIRAEITKKHRYTNGGSWKNSSDKLWSSNPWEVAKCYFPPKGYEGKNSAQETDFDGIISFMLNCLHFDSKFSFVISKGQTYSQTCLLFKARELRNEICHPPSLEISDQKLQEYLTTLIKLLSDSKCLAQDKEANTAVLKLDELQNEKMSFNDLIELLKKSHKTLKDVNKPGELIYKEMDETLAKALKILEARIQDLEKRHENTETRVQVLEERHENTETRVQVLEERHENTETRVQVLEERHENTETRVQDVEERHENTETRVQVLEEGHENTETRVQVLEERHENTETRVQDVEERHENTETQLQDLEERYENTESQVQILEERHENIETRVQDLDERHENTDMRVQDLEERTENIETKVKDLKEQNEYIETQVQDLKERSKSNIQAVNQIEQEEYERGVEELIERTKKLYRDTLNHMTRLIDEYFFKEDREKAYKLVNEIMKREQCLILLDGLDEWTGPGDHHNLPELV